MGRRRIRCLRTMGFADVVGVDPRADRRQQTNAQYGVTTFADFGTALAAGRPDALVISVPPDVHHLYMKEAARLGIHFFVEASVVDTGIMDVAAAVRGTGVVAAPSATLLFHPAIRLISGVLSRGELGKISNFILHSGQYLPDWHTYEQVADYYVSRRETGGAREIVPFELSWLVSIFGHPTSIKACVRKTIDIAGADEIDDTYNCLLDYGDRLGVLVVDVVSRRAVRRLVINGSEYQLLWDWDDPAVRLFGPGGVEAARLGYEISASEEGYNANIGESMYIDEVAAFLAAVRGEKPFPRSLEDDHRVLQVLYSMESDAAVGARS
jgi:predicted dehydrogenase